MTSDGVLFVQEHLSQIYGEEIETSLREAGYHSTSFKLNGEGKPRPKTHGGEWGNLENRWPSRSEIPIMQFQDRVGTLTVELESTVKTGMWDEYIGKEVVDYEISIRHPDMSQR